MVLAARNAVYGLAMSRVITGSFARRAIAAQLTIDESTAMASAQEDPAAKRHAFWITGVAVYVCWNAATLVGALVGTAIDPATYGLDVAFPAGFVAMVAPHLRHRLGLIAAVCGALICLVLIPFTPVGVPILCASRPCSSGCRRRTRGMPTTCPTSRCCRDLDVGAGARCRGVRLQVPRTGRHRLAAAPGRARAVSRPRPRGAAQRPGRPGHVADGSGPRDRRASPASPSPPCWPGGGRRSSSSLSPAAATTALLRQL